MKVLFFSTCTFLVLLFTHIKTTAQNVGIGTTVPANKLDIQTAARSGLHATERPLYVTGLPDSNKNGIEFRHTNGTQGIGFGYNTIYATGSATNQDLSFAAKGTGSLSYYTNNVQRMVIDDKGCMTITADVNGLETSKDSYPLRVQGSDQGIAITVDGFTSNARNYITFWDESPASPGNPVPARGRVEGQSIDELVNSFDYIWTVAIASLRVASPTVEAIACGIDQDAAEVISNVFAAYVATARLAEYIISAQLAYGVTYESGGADYAEWIEKKVVNENFNFGDVVGVRNGKISKTTTGADHLMIISMAPVVLGNMPEKGREQQFEKVAFMGQVPVKVTGKVALGDYILASGNNDGFGYAVHPEEMKAGDYDQFIGVAWSESQAEKKISYIKVAVGINSNSMAAEVTKRYQKIVKMKEELADINTYLAQKDPAFKPHTTINPQPTTVMIPVKTTEKPANEENKETQIELIKRMEANPAVLKDAVKLIRTELEKKGLDIEKLPELKKLLTDEKYFLEMYKKKFLVPGS